MTNCCERLNGFDAIQLTSTTQELVTSDFLQAKEFIKAYKCYMYNTTLLKRTIYIKVFLSVKT